MKLSIPYVRGISKIIKEYKNNIYDVYFTDDVLQSARPRTTHNTEYMNLYKEMEEIRVQGVKRTFLLNSIMINDPSLKDLRSDPVRKTVNHLARIKDKYDIITVNNLMYLYDPDFIEVTQGKKLKNSVNNKIDSLYKLEECFKITDWDAINIDRRINRNNKLINQMCKAVRDKGAVSYVLVNEGCHWDCIFKEYCDISMTDRNQMTSFSCLEHYNIGKPESYLKTPLLFHDNVQHIDADVFKISGRFNPVDIIEKRIRHYLYGENITLGELIDKPFEEGDPVEHMDYKTLNKYSMTEYLYDCKNNCLNCSKCDNIRNIL